MVVGCQVWPRPFPTETRRRRGAYRVEARWQAAGRLRGKPGALQCARPQGCAGEGRFVSGSVGEEAEFHEVGFHRHGHSEALAYESHLHDVRAAF